jgi:DEAD/DEAH box helicase domain-containing protein
MSAPAVVYLDVETQRSLADVGGWENRRNLGVSIVVTLSAEGLRIFTEAEIPELAAQLESAEKVIGYNLRDFDCEVLAGYPAFADRELRVLDLMEVVNKSAGRRVSLQSLAAATLGRAPALDSLYLVTLWKAGAVAKVIEGCCNDVLNIKALHEHGRDHGVVYHFPSGAGGAKERLQVDWKIPPAPVALPGVDEPALDRFAEAGREAWADVPDAAEWVRELRGD